MDNSITTIVPHKEDPNLRSIFVGETCVATLTSNAISLLGIEVGNDWNEEIAEGVSLHEDELAAREIAIDLLSRKMWTSKELQTRLIKREIERSVASSTIEGLIEDGWLNDSTYATAYIKELTRLEPASKLWLSQKLRNKFLDDAIIKDSIQKAFEDTCEQDAANAFATGRISKISQTNDEQVKKKVLGALQRRGFTSDVSHEAFRIALIESSS